MDSGETIPVLTGGGQFEGPAKGMFLSFFFLYPHPRIYLLILERKGGGRDIDVKETSIGGHPHVL